MINNPQELSAQLVLENIIAKEVAAEREACALVCETMARRCQDIRVAALEMAAENIRARIQ